jgi:hypothetical protein
MNLDRRANIVASTPDWPKRADFRRFLEGGTFLPQLTAPQLPAEADLDAIALKTFSYKS